MKIEYTLQNLSDFENKSLLIVDDDNPFRERLARAMEKKGFEVIQAESVQNGIDTVKVKKPVSLCSFMFLFAVGLHKLCGFPNQQLRIKGEIAAIQGCVDSLDRDYIPPFLEYPAKVSEGKRF